MLIKIMKRGTRDMIPLEQAEGGEGKRGERERERDSLMDVSARRAVSKYGFLSGTISGGVSAPENL